FRSYDLVPLLPKNYYGGAMHDYFGEYLKTCSDGYCKLSLRYSDVQMKTPANTDFRVFHRYGYLWKPATEATRGFAQFFFDGEPIGRAVRWDKYGGQPPALNHQPWTFGILDQNH